MVMMMDYEMIHAIYMVHCNYAKCLCEGRPSDDRTIGYTLGIPQHSMGQSV